MFTSYIKFTANIRTLGYFDTFPMNELETIQSIFELNTIAVVGMSPKPERPSHYVSMYMKDNGYTIIPVNPGHDEIAGLKCYPSLSDAAVEFGAKALWLQDGVINEEAAEFAESSGLLVVMNDCMLRRHRQFP